VAELEARHERLTQIAGAPPALTRPPGGCGFHPRCAFALPVCERVAPALLSADCETHLAACHLDASVRRAESARVAAR
jgi:oligopeptide/dipeptide ABC transporter ATP-binding protein